ncbi:MAG TPA: lactaldehyde reductase [Candidatus Coprosoma intestinipullorum]|uniref:Lactaldehyde reductase n=1 Tax=Candidatus Coprosoma intestinipullorum TaxID=2840752 RepID=A0A9D1CXU3_9FIRM|nr:lactaldehyde reductase [Candidatus Coprosoma intestinipullorum]
MINRIILNETSYFGPGAREKLVPEITKRGYKKVLLVTDETLMKCGVAKKVIDTLEAGHIDYQIFDQIKPDPSIDNCKEGIEACKKAKADCIVAVGGGSVIDSAKCIGIVMENPEFSDIRSLEGTADTKHRSLPLIAMPTTSGTAAEVTINYVITDPEYEVKRVCVDPNDIPVLAIVDTDLMAEAPVNTIAATGMDALTHAMEGYITKGHWVMSDMFHLKAMEMIYENLPKAAEKNRKAIDNMGIAQYIAGMGFSNVGLGIVHSLAHQLGALYHVPHGFSCALFLPYVLKWNGQVAKERYRDIAKAFKADTEGLSDDECVDLVVQKVRDLESTLKLKTHLSEYGVKKEDFDKFAKQALVDPCTSGNPREVTEEDLLEIIKEAY